MNKILPVLIPLYFFATVAYAQQSITGTVRDDSGTPLPGAAVYIRSTNITTITDANGNFTLSAAQNPPFTLIVSFVGYRSYELEVYEAPGEPIAVVLQASVLDEVVVIGYGTQRKREVTGAIGSVSQKDFNKGLVQSPDQLFAGRVAGVQITQSSNEPGGGATIRIRGANSINASNEPLYVIDGLPIDNTPVTPSASVVSDPAPRNPLNALNPNDIESVEILKDASATAIYGSRGANGVIIITTKKGTSGRLNVDYALSTGVSSVAKEVRMLNARQYVNFLNDVNADRGVAPEFTGEQIAAIGEGTDWQEEIFRDAVFQNHQLNFSGGRDNLTFYTGLNYVDQEGVVLNSGIRKYIARLNVGYAGDKFNFGVNLNTSLIKDKYAPSGVSINENAGVIYSAIFQDPTLPVFNDDGSYGITRIVNLENPYALTQEIQDNALTTRIFGNIFGEYNFTPELSAKINIGTDQQQSRRDAYISRLLKRGEGTRGIASVRNNEAGNDLIEFTARYNKAIDSHQLEVLAGYTYQVFTARTLNAGAQNFPLDALETDNLGAGAQNTFTLGTSRSRNQLQSYLGRVNYNFDDRYLITASIRADGSSRFGENNKFGYFPSVAAGWRISEESFLQSINVLSDLKLRVSYGLTGSQEIGNYNSQILFGPQGQAVIGGASQVGVSATQLPNPDLKWETTRQFNAGIDFGFFDGRLSGAIDYFVKNTEDLLLDLPIPRTTGFSTRLTNIGSLKNSGFELSLSSVNIRNNSFEWTTTLNLSTIRNEVTSIGGLPFILGGAAGFITDFTIIRTGDPLNAYYGYAVDGVYQLDDNIAASPQPLARPGEYKYKDVSGDGRINADDRTILGKPFPDYTFGFSNDLRYGPFSLSVFLQGVQGIELFNMNRTESENPISFRRNRLEVAYTDRWTPDNPTNANSSSVPVAVSYASNVNSRAVEDASYIRLRNIQLAYSLPVPDGWGLRSAQVYVAAQNLFTITDYTGYDPEVSAFGTSNVRADFNAYPLTQTFSIGATIGF